MVGTSKAGANYTVLPCQRLAIIASPWVAPSQLYPLKVLHGSKARRIPLLCRCRNSGVSWKVSPSKSGERRHCCFSPLSEVRI